MRSIYRKFVSFSFVFSFVFLFPQVANAGSFPDVTQDNANYKAIQYLKDNGHIGGYGDGTFKPESEINRAEATKIIVSALGIPLDNDSLVLFGDVNKSEWFFPYIMGAYKAGIIGGHSDGTFKPINTINLAEALKIISEALKIKLSSDFGKEKIFSDVDSTEWHAKYAFYAREKNIVLMDDYGRANIGASLTRGAFSEVMYRFLVVRDSGGKEFPLENDWNSYSSSESPFAIKYPTGWEVLTYGGDFPQTVFWKNDKGFYQFSPERIYPNTAKIVVGIDSNKEGLTKTEYFSNVKMVFAKGKASEFKVGNFDTLQISFEDQFVKDWYVYLSSGKNSGMVLVVYTQNGPGVTAYQNRKFLDLMLKTFEYKDVLVNNSSGGGDNSSLKNQIFQKILVEGAGQSVFSLISDEYIIETDSMGVGTGPIDYYYTSTLNLTLKYERAGDVILDYRDGQTTAF